MVRRTAERHSGCMSPRHSVIKVFLADDSELIRMRVAALLVMPATSIVGYAHTPQASIDGIRATQPNVVVLDVQLEGGSGLEVLRAIHLSAPEIAFIVFTNNSGPAYRERYLREGAVRFLDKSTEFGSLASAVASAQLECERAGKTKARMNTSVDLDGSQTRI